jgi:hypothetical protein
MTMLALFPLVCLSTVADDPAVGALQTVPGAPSAIFERAARQPDLDEAGLVLSSLLSDDSAIRSAFLSSAVPDERSRYVLFSGDWGTRATVTWKDRQRLLRISVESISAKPALVRFAVRAGRYSTYFGVRSPWIGSSTIGPSTTFFEWSPYADDLVELSIEGLRKETDHPAKPLLDPHALMQRSRPPRILRSAEEEEIILLASWQIACGLCDRMDLIEKATTSNWRDRFLRLDRWFRENRPYVVWDESKCCIRIDEDARRLGTPTRRSLRSIPELRPPWLPAETLKGRPTP